MAVPKSRKSKSKVKTKRSHIHMTQLEITTNLKGQNHIRHFAVLPTKKSSKSNNKG